MSIKDLSWQKKWKTQIYFSNFIHNMQQCTIHPVLSHLQKKRIHVHEYYEDHSNIGSSWGNDLTTKLHFKLMEETIFKKMLIQQLLKTLFQLHNGNYYQWVVMCTQCWKVMLSTLPYMGTILTYLYFIWVHFLLLYGREMFYFLLHYIYLITLVTLQTRVNNTKHNQQINHDAIL